MMKTGVKYLIIIGGILLIAGVAFSYFRANDWYDQWKDQIVQEERQIQNDLKEQLKDLAAQKAQKDREIKRLETERKELRLKYLALEGKVDELEKKMAALHIPDNPDDIAVGLRNSGLESAVSRPAKRNLP